MKYRVLFFPLITSFLIACSNEPTPPAPNEESSTKVENSAEENPSKKEYSVEEVMSRPDMRDSNNIASALRYAETNELTSLWGTLCRLSEWAEEVHSGKYVFLCPTNAALARKGTGSLLELKARENRDVLNKLMARHILKTHINLGNLGQYPVVETISGEKLNLNAEALTIDGIPIMKSEMKTNKGTVIILDGVIGYPTDIRKEKELILQPQK
jgi:uncharacterized surface protein with fasciclin (FAS1) repeats